MCTAQVAVAIEADQKSFQLYMGGVYDDEDGCGTALDHGVLAVGYGREAKLVSHVTLLSLPSPIVLMCWRWATAGRLRW